MLPTIRCPELDHRRDRRSQANPTEQHSEGRAWTDHGIVVCLPIYKLAHTSYSVRDRLVEESEREQARERVPHARVDVLFSMRTSSSTKATSRRGIICTSFLNIARMGRYTISASDSESSRRTWSACTLRRCWKDWCISMIRVSYIVTSKVPIS